MTRKRIYTSDNQAHLPFRDKRAGGIFSYATVLEQRMLTALWGASLLLCLIYIYFLASSVGYVSAREEALKNMHGISGETTALESAYLARSLAMTEGEAELFGLVHVRPENFVERAGSLTVVR